MDAKTQDKATQEVGEVFTVSARVIEDDRPVYIIETHYSAEAAMGAEDRLRAAYPSARVVVA